MVFGIVNAGKYCTFTGIKPTTRNEKITKITTKNDEKTTVELFNIGREKNFIRKI